MPGTNAGMVPINHNSILSFFPLAALHLNLRDKYQNDQNIQRYYKQKILY